MLNKVTQVYFSPSGKSEEVCNLVRENVEIETSEDIDLLRQKTIDKTQFSDEELVIVSIPVFGGRLPKVAAEKVKLLKGNNTPAIAIVVFGNRAYEDAMIELTDIMTENGFNVYGAGAFIARHSIIPEVAKNRPDEVDKKVIKSFTEKCLSKIENSDTEPYSIRGAHPYRDYAFPIQFKPKTNSNCTKCGKCVDICPMNAIDKKNPRKTIRRKCISCTACINNCPAEARRFGGLMYMNASRQLEAMFSEPKDPEMFF